MRSGHDGKSMSLVTRVSKLALEQAFGCASGGMKYFLA